MIKFKILDKFYSLSEDGIQDICLFGSYARGESDEMSDMDVFILIDDCDEKTFIKRKETIESELGMPADWISLYRKSTIEKMLTYGSYFLWHLKTEGKILYSKTGLLELALNNLPKYNKVEDDLMEYLAICNDVKVSIQKDCSTLSYELSVLASLVRNTCIALSYLHGKLVFGRITPVEVCQKIMGDTFPFSIDEYTELYKFRVMYSRDNNSIITIQPTRELVEIWIERVEELIRFSLNSLREECGKDAK